MKEEFEKFMDKMSVRHIRETSEYDRLQEAFLAGAAKGVTTMREKCAEVADNEANGFRNTRIAAAIRKIEVE